MGENTSVGKWYTCSGDGQIEIALPSVWAQSDPFEWGGAVQNCRAIQGPRHGRAADNYVPTRAHYVQIPSDLPLKL